jgi:hypothetical protein
MSLLRSVFFLAVVAAASLSLAADKQANPSAAGSEATLATQAVSPEPSAFGVAPSTRDPKEEVPTRPHALPAGQKVLTLAPGTLDGTVCLTLRTYRVKRTERLSENESGMIGYSNCQMASKFRVRSAVGEEVLQVPAQ